MRIAIIDDERPARSELSYQLRQLIPDVELEEAGSGAQALELISHSLFDILFVDIHLGDLKGTDLASVLKKTQPNAKIVFATAYSDYAAKAFELQVDDYLLKPFDPDRLEQVLRRCMPRPGVKPAMDALSGKLAVTKDRHSTLIDISQVVYIETDGVGRGCILHTTLGNHSDTVSMAEYEKKLTLKGFFRIHKSYLVQLALIADFFPWAGNGFALRMRGFEDTVLPIGRDRVKELRQLLSL